MLLLPSSIITIIIIDRSYAMDRPGVRDEEAPAHVKCEVEGRRLINFIVSDVFDNARHYTPHKLHMALVLGHEESARDSRALIV